MNDDNPTNDEQTQADAVQNERVLHEKSNSSMTERNHRPTMSEDWLAVWIGGALLTLSLVAVLMNLPASYREANPLSDTGSSAALLDEPAVAPDEPITNPLKPFLSKSSRWTTNPLDAIYPEPAIGILGVLVISFAVFGIGAKVQGSRFAEFAPGFLFVFLLALTALALAAQTVAKQYNLEYALWALAIGLLLSNTIGTPSWVRPAVRTEFYIKTGLVLLGCQGFVQSVAGTWPARVVCRVGCHTRGADYDLLVWPAGAENRIEVAHHGSRSRHVGLRCFVRHRHRIGLQSKKEELSLVIGISLSFTVVMMVVMPWIVKTTGMNEVVGGAWIGGTIDSSGAVVAAGELVSPAAGFAAVTIKMIQNILIGVVAFGVAMYWVGYVENDGSESKPEIVEIWRRFPKFILGFLAASAVFSIFHATLYRGPENRHCNTQRGQRNASQLVLCAGVCQHRTRQQFSRTGKISTRRQTVAALHMRPNPQSLPHPGHGLASVRGNFPPMSPHASRESEPMGRLLSKTENY